MVRVRGFETPVTAPAHSRRREFYVYTIRACGRVFYVGIGRKARLSDRQRWVRSQVAREKAGLPARWVRHTKVMATCIRQKIPLTERKLKSRVTRRQALAYEKVAIARYLKRGHVLANHHYNKGFKGTALQIYRNIRKYGRTCGGR